MAVSIDKQTFTLQFQKKVTLELAVLNQKLSHQLRHEITQAFEQSLYTDLEVSLGYGGGGGGAVALRSHRCIVEARAPKFYSKVCANSRRRHGHGLPIVLPDSTDRHSLEAFFRTLYWCNDVTQAENDIVKQLKRVYQLQQQQQKAATPEESDDVYLTPQASPSEAVVHSGGVIGTTSHRQTTNALYYSLVPIDEVFDSDCSTGGGGVLEKELAEQDQLFKSFKSILNKEQRTTASANQKKNRTKPTSLSLTSSLNPKHSNNTDSVQRIVFHSRRKVEVVKRPVGGVEEEEEEEKSTNYDCSSSGNVQPVSSGMEMNRGMSGAVALVNDDTMSNPETEVVSSSGYVTGSSPREHTVSVSEEAVTEAASSEDMPHDDIVVGGGNEGCPASSSSVSSEDGGTWDSAAPASSNLPDLVQIENNLNAVDLFEPVPVRIKSEDSSKVVVSSKCLSPDHTSVASKNNFFIDASSLLDESELQQTNYCQSSCRETESDPPPEMGEGQVNGCGQLTFEERRAALVRRNTFELEPDLGKKCRDPAAESKPPDSLLIVAKNGAQDDEMHSPDSLNNDVPLDVMLDSAKVVNNNDKTMTSLPDCQNGEQCDASKLYNSGLFYNVENTLDQCFKYDKDELNENGGGSSSNRIESMPIVSGGASISDFSPPVVSCSSPMARRRTEQAPILSGGSVVMESDVSKPKPKPKPATASTWVVDMSDAIKSPQTSRKKKRIGGSSSGSTSEEHDDKSPAAVKTSSNPTAMGFFIPLDDPKPTNSKPSPPACQDSKSSSQNNINQTSSSSCGFFIDLTTTNTTTTNTKQSEKKVEKNAAGDKKLFSMFIDISETSSMENVSSQKSSPNLFASKKLKPKAQAGRFHSKQADDDAVALRSSDSQLSSESSMELAGGEHPEVARGKHLFSEPNCTPPPSRQISTNENSTADLTVDSSARKKGGFFMFIEAADSSPVPRRRTLPSGLRPNSQRHSWNLETAAGSKNGDSHQHVPAVEEEAKKEHKRAHSVSSAAAVDERRNSSSMVVKESGPASIDEAQMRQPRSLMIASWHGPVKPTTELQKVLARKELRTSKEQQQQQQSEAASLSCDDVRTESAVSDLSSSCCSGRGGNNSTFIVEDVSNVANAATSQEMEDLSTTSHEELLSLEDGGGDKKVHDQQKQVREAATARSSFVKLSDMDKDPPPAVKLATVGRQQQRMSRSIPEAGSWLESRLMTRSATSRSLGRLFPHLRHRRHSSSPPAADDLSQLSSMHSSATAEPHSALEGSTTTTTTTEDGWVEGGGACSRLGEDLLRMFVEEISCDVVVEVGGRRLRAHKCILASRCQYFAAMLSGGWVESAGNVISLQGFSYNAVHFALCHIYSGTSNIPDSINIVELATLADMLCLEGLKEVIMYTLKVKYCHFFHKPCGLCTVGVLECLPLAAAYGLDEIYRKSLRWISKHFVRVWPTKGFATLPRELIDKCLKQHLVHMSVDNVLETVLNCEKLEAIIPEVRWADPVVQANQRLHDAACKFVSQHFSGVLASDMFLSLGKDSSCNLERVKKTLLAAVEKGLSPDQACRSLARLHTILAIVSSPSPSSSEWTQEFVLMVEEVSGGCERWLVKQAGRAVRCSGWLQLDAALRSRIQQQACLVVVPGDERRRARMHHSLHRRSEDRSSSCSSSGLRSSDLHQVKVVMSQQNVGSRKQPLSDATRTLVNRASVPQTTRAAAARSDNDSHATSTVNKTKSWPHRLAEVKSRYLEQRAPLKSAAAAAAAPAVTNGSSSGAKCWSVPAQRKAVGGAKGGGKPKPIISSSDSSRTSSPAMRRSLPPRTHILHQQQQQQRQHSAETTLSMSTDSLVEVVASKQVELNGVRRPRTTTTLKKTTAASAAQPMTAAAKTKSAESLVASKGGIASKLIINKGSSPQPLSRRTPTSQTSPRVAPALLTRASKAQATTCSPVARRNTSASAAPTQPSQAANGVKRNTTYRVVQPPTTNTKPKLNQNNNNNNNNSNNNTTNNCNNHQRKASPLLNRVKQQQPGVGSRSGTFLKDEPTVLAKQPAPGQGQCQGQESRADVR